MTENEVTYIIRGAAFKVHSKLGPGLLESIYEKFLIYELTKVGLKIKQQVPLPIIYDDNSFECGFRLDLLVEDLIVIEIKSTEALAKVHFKQIMTYLRISKKRIGLLINFNTDTLDKYSMVRVINDPNHFPSC